MIEQRRRLEPYEAGRFDLSVGLRDREGDALVLCQLAPEDLPLRRIPDCALNEPAAVTDRLRCDQDPLHVPAVDYVTEALPLLANQILLGDLHVLEEDLVD